MCRVQIGNRRSILVAALWAATVVLGASIADASSITAKQSVVPTFGAFVGSVRAGSVAERTGLAPGDIITELNIQPISNADGLERALSALGSGSRFTLVVLRGGKTYTLESMF